MITLKRLLTDRHENCHNVLMNVVLLSLADDNFHLCEVIKWSSVNYVTYFLFT